jgi:hypothetical protein
MLLLVLVFSTAESLVLLVLLVLLGDAELLLLIE